MFDRARWLTFTLLMLGCQGNSVQHELAGEQESIYSAVINELFLDPPSSPQKLLIHHSTQIPLCYLIERIVLAHEDLWSVALKTVRKVVPGASEELLGDFVSENQRERRLENRLTLMSEYDLGDFGLADLSHFKSTGAAGLVSLSSIGFNLSRDEALLHAGMLTSERSGYGCLVLLSKLNGKWLIKFKYNLWIA